MVEDHLRKAMVAAGVPEDRVTQLVITWSFSSAAPPSFKSGVPFAAEVVLRSYSTPGWTVEQYRNARVLRGAFLAGTTSRLTAAMEWRLRERGTGFYLNWVAGPSDRKPSLDGVVARAPMEGVVERAPMDGVDRVGEVRQALKAGLVEGRRIAAGQGGWARSLPSVERLMGRYVRVGWDTENRLGSGVDLRLVETVPGEEVDRGPDLPGSGDVGSSRKRDR
ncbi:hypothetical protein, partial [Lentzea flava]|uniref:hypothetical protein n=1 Tax=Lentzea flava TaxID=103732 RepID=UPI00167072B5